MRTLPTALVLGSLLATVLGGLAGCSGAAPEATATNAAAAIDAVSAAGADPGTLVATIPASAPGVTSWNVYTNVAADGSSTVTVLGVDDSNNLVAGAVLTPNQGVVGVGTNADASQTEAQGVLASLSNDVSVYVDPSGGDPSDQSVHTLGNPFGLSDCTYAVLSVISSIAGTIGGTVGVFSTCPVSLGVGCVAGVVMTLTGAAVGVYNVDKAVNTCSGPTPTAACQSACAAIGSSQPTCMEEDPISSCYADCASTDTTALTTLTTCVSTALQSTPDSDGSDAGDPCAPLVGCFSAFGN